MLRAAFETIHASAGILLIVNVLLILVGMFLDSTTAILVIAPILAKPLVADIAKVSMKEVLREMLPYYIPLGITLLLITYIPSLTTWLPRLVMG